MTLIVGIKCQEGIVIGADSITTFGSAIEQEVDNKIEFLSADALIASAGAVGMSQAVVASLQLKWDDVRAERSIVGARNKISELLWEEMTPALHRAKEAESLFGGKIVGSLACNFMIGFSLGGCHRLLVYDESAQPIEVTTSSPFFSIGSGSFQADPFLAFIKRVIWNDNAPKTLSDGIFCVLWTLDHVSRVNAGLGVGGRPRVFVLRRGNEDAWHANELSEDHLGEQLVSIELAESALRTFTGGFGHN